MWHITDHFGEDPSSQCLAENSKSEQKYKMQPNSNIKNRRLNNDHSKLQIYMQTKSNKTIASFKCLLSFYAIRLKQAESIM